MVRTAIQLFTLKDLDEPVWEVVSRVGERSFDGVEFYAAHFDAFEDDDALQRTSDALAAADLSVAGAHVGADRIEGEFDDVVDACTAVGVSTLVVPTYDPEAFASVDGIESAADRLGGLAADLAEQDIDLLYHNHTFEFVEVDGEVAFELFVDRTDDRLGFQPDVGLATHAGYDASSLLELVADRSPIVHLTDAIPEDPDALHTDAGDGVVDLEACVDAAAANGAEWLVCENGRTDDALASLERGSEAFAAFSARVTDREFDR